MDRIKRITYEILDGHKSKFGEDFADNKKALNQISIVRSKSLKIKLLDILLNLLKKRFAKKKLNRLVLNLQDLNKLRLRFRNPLKVMMHLNLLKR